MRSSDGSAPDELQAVEIVGSGYDRMAARYLASYRPGGARDRFLWVIGRRLVDRDSRS